MFLFKVISVSGHKYMQTGKVFEFASTMLPCPGQGQKQCCYIILILQAAQFYIQM